jgi:hypothetical protein
MKYGGGGAVSSETYHNSFSASGASFYKVIVYSNETSQHDTVLGQK